MEDFQHFVCNLVNIAYILLNLLCIFNNHWLKKKREFNSFVFKMFSIHHIAPTTYQAIINRKRR